jgi:hypothetical protein
VNCNQELCIELWSVINFHCEIEPAKLLHYYYIIKLTLPQVSLTEDNATDFTVT